MVDCQDHDELRCVKKTGSVAVAWDTAPSPSTDFAVRKRAAAPNQVAVFEGHQTKKQKVSLPTIAASLRGQPTTVVKVHAPPGFLGFILKPKKPNRAVSITKIDNTCVVKDQILIGDQLIGVNDDYFRDCAYSFRDVIQLIKNKQSNPVRILTFQRYKKDEIWYIVRVIPAAEEQILCRIKECSKDAAVSWAFNLNPEDIWDLCEGCQVIERGGWPTGVVPITTLSPPPTTTLPPVVNNTQVELSVMLPLVVEDPEAILLQNVDCYISGLLASFPRETLNKMVHKILILYPQSNYAIEKERHILHQRCGGRPGLVGFTYITFEWKHIKEVLCILCKNAPGCREFVKHFCAYFVDNSDIGCTGIRTLGQWYGIRIYGPGAESTNHYDITRYLNWRDVSSLCVDPLQDCGLDVYAQSLGDDGKVHGNNKNHHVASFPVPSGGSIIMSKIATGCSGEGRDGLPLTLPTTHHEKTYFNHQSKQIPCIRMALIVDFVELHKKMYESFIQEKFIPDSLVFTDVIQAELTHQFQQANTQQVRTIHQEKWLAKYNELIEYEKLSRSAAFMCGGKLGTWVKTQRAQYKSFKEG